MVFRYTLWFCHTCKEQVQQSFNSDFYCNCRDRWMFELFSLRKYELGEAFSYAWPTKWGLA